MKTCYWKGFLAEYTGKSSIIHGGRFYEIRIIEEGPYLGQIKVTQRAPT